MNRHHTHANSVTSVRVSLGLAFMGGLCVGVASAVAWLGPGGGPLLAMRAEPPAPVARQPQSDALRPAETAARGDHGPSSEAERIAVDAACRSTAEQQIESWRAYALELERLIPGRRVMRALSITQTKLDQCLSHSSIVKDQVSLELALSIMEPDTIMQLWKAEDEFFTEMGKMRLASPATVPGSTHTDRMQYHNSVMIPWVGTALPRLCNRLYQMGTPAHLVEGFRTRILADF